MEASSTNRESSAGFAPRHFYFSRYLCVTNGLGCAGIVIAAIVVNPSKAILTLPFAAWAYVCVRELIQRKPAITVTNQGIVIRKLIFADADMRFEDIESIAKNDIFGVGTLFQFHLKASFARSSYEITIFNNQHLNCSIEAEDVVEAIKTAHPGIEIKVP